MLEGDSNKQLLLLLGRLLLGLSLLEPGEERLSGLADLLGDGDLGVLLAGLGTPLLDNLLTDEVEVVVELQDLDDLGVDVRVVLGEVTEETLGTTKESPFVLLAVDDLVHVSIRP